MAVLFIWICSIVASRPSQVVSSPPRPLWAKSSQAAASHLQVCSDGRRPQKMCLRCFMPYVLKNTSRIRVHRPRMKPSGGCQSLCFGFWMEEEGEEEEKEGESRERLAAWRSSSCVYLSSQGKHPIFMRWWAHFYLRGPIPGTRRQGFTQKAGGEAHHYTSPVVFCPIRCRIITLCTIILLNLTRIKHASHKGHIYMLMPPQHSAVGDEI